MPAAHDHHREPARDHRRIGKIEHLAGKLAATSSSATSRMPSGRLGWRLASVVSGHRLTVTPLIAATFTSLASSAWSMDRSYGPVSHNLVPDVPIKAISRCTSRDPVGNFPKAICSRDRSGEHDMDRQQLLEELERIVGADGVRHRPVDLMVYEYDGSVDGAVDTAPPTAVDPAHAPREQVAAIVRLARKAGLPVVARGAGTGLSGGAVAQSGGIIIALTRMDRDNRRRSGRSHRAGRTWGDQPRAVRTVRGEGSFSLPIRRARRHARSAEMSPRTQAVPTASSTA